MSMTFSASNDMIVREPRHSDSAAITDIYNFYVASSAVTFNETPWTVASTREWIDAHDNAGPGRVLLVAEGADGAVLGYAFSDPFRGKDGYRYSCETTVYVDHLAHGQGIGKQLLGSLIDKLRTVGAHRAYGFIAMPNDASVRVHVAVGYRRVGSMNEVGHKFGEWHSTELWELDLA
jgi:phosphinothricin acetyltransferase